MRFMVLLVLFFLGAIDIASSQDVDNLIELVSGRGKRQSLSTEAVNSHIEGKIDGWVDVTFDFQVLPGPLTTAQATLILEIVRGQAGDTFEGDWEFSIGANPTTVKWLSDQTVIWAGNKVHGDQLVVHIEFISVRSGSNGFSFAFSHLLGQGYGVRVAWCLDGDGQLLGLYNPKHNRMVPCTGAGSFFFDQDSVSIPEPNITSDARIPFNTRMTVTPPFRIGDTSTVRFYLTAKETIPGGLDFRFSTVHMAIISFPDRVDYSISAGETVEFAVDVVPAAVRNVQTIGLESDFDFHTTGRESRLSTQACSAVFNEDGSLRYIDFYGLGQIDKGLLPMNFPEAANNGSRDYKSIYKNRPHPYPDLIK